MGVMRAEPARFADWATRSVGAAWRLFDLQLLTYATLLASTGLVMAYSNSVEPGQSVLEGGSTFLRGLMWAGIAIVVFVVASAFDYKWLKTFAWPLYLIQLGLLLLTLAVGDGVGGSARWVSVGPFVFQFSELAKILMVVVLANYLGARARRLDSLGSILGACVLVGPPWILVMLQPDLGTSLVFAAITAGMLFMSGASLRWLAVLGAAVVAILPFAWNNILRDYQKERLTSFLNPTPDIQGAGYQLHQAQIAVGSGGWMGKGLTNGTQNQLDFLPVQTTDFVFAILAEELGFIGAMVVFGLFAGAPLAGPDSGLALARSVRDDVLLRHRLDDPVPADHQRRDGHRRHADHGHSPALRHPRRRVAGQPGRRARHHPEHQHPPDPRGVVSGPPPGSPEPVDRR